MLGGTILSYTGQGESAKAVIEHEVNGTRQMNLE